MQTEEQLVKSNNIGSFYKFVNKVHISSRSGIPHHMFGHVVRLDDHTPALPRIITGRSSKNWLPFWSWLVATARTTAPFMDPADRRRYTLQHLCRMFRSKARHRSHSGLTQVATAPLLSTRSDDDDDDGIPPIINDDHVTVTDDQAKTGLFNEYFASVGRPDNGFTSYVVQALTAVNESNVIATIKKLKNN